MEVALDLHTMLSDSFGLRVSILVFMEVALDHYFQSYLSWFRCVSILVFMEVALDLLNLTEDEYNRCVSILVFMEVALDQFHLSRFPGLLYSVSILVFMEVALDLYATYLRLIQLLCFNPCFHGSSSRSIFQVTYRMHGMMFQSLFSWK